jgi:hypothetical protein
MNEQELIEALSIIGRYEVVNYGGGFFVVLPLCNNEILIGKDSHDECKEFFHDRCD